LAAAHARPMAYVADIHVDEGRAGGRIVADAAVLHLQPDLAQLGERYVRQVEVERVAQLVLALLGDAAGTAAQHLVGRRRTIAADDVDVVARAGSPVNLPHEVEQARVDLDLLVLAPVAEDMVDLLQA